MGATDMPRCVSPLSHNARNAMAAAAAVSALLSISHFIPSMASIIEAICSFKANMSAFICSYTSSRSPIVLDLDLVR